MNMVRQRVIGHLVVTGAVGCASLSVIPDVSASEVFASEREAGEHVEWLVDRYKLADEEELGWDELDGIVRGADLSNRLYKRGVTWRVIPVYMEEPRPELSRIGNDDLRSEVDNFIKRLRRRSGPDEKYLTDMLDKGATVIDASGVHTGKPDASKTPPGQVRPATLLHWEAEPDLDCHKCGIYVEIGEGFSSDKGRVCQSCAVASLPEGLHKEGK